MAECEYQICIPENTEALDQHEEWIEIGTATGMEKILLHEYGRFYEIPGLYDDLYRRLQCQSPNVVCQALKEQMQKAAEDPFKVRALDFGAGNGQIGEQLSSRLDCEAVVGLDIIPQAREAARRDRPEVYDHYYVADLANLSDADRALFSQWRFNTLVTVAALGYGDIGAKAFANAINLIEDGGWIAFNIKDRFLSESDSSGFHKALQTFVDQGFELVHSHRYRHRYSLAGEPLHYYVIVGRKYGEISWH